jgi:hypothetical protein
VLLKIDVLSQRKSIGFASGEIVQDLAISGWIFNFSSNWSKPLKMIASPYIDTFEKAGSREVILALSL